MTVHGVSTAVRTIVGVVLGVPSTSVPGSGIMFVSASGVGVME